MKIDFDNMIIDKITSVEIYDKLDKELDCKNIKLKLTIPNDTDCQSSEELDAFLKQFVRE